MVRNQGRNANIVYGICTNTGGKEDGTPCSKCQNKEKQAIRASKDFVCEECGEPLTKVDGPGPKPPTWLYVILVLAVIGIGIGAYLIFFRSNEPPIEPPIEPPYAVSLSLNKETIILDSGACDTLRATVSTTPGNHNMNVSVSFTSDDANVAQIDNNGVVRAVAKGETTITVVALSPNGSSDTIKVRVTVNALIDKAPETITQNDILSKKTPKQSTIKVGFGDFDGVTTIMVTKQHIFHLKDVNRSSVTVYPGDQLRDCIIKNGVLSMFQIVRPNGERETILDVNEKLY